MAVDKLKFIFLTSSVIIAEYEKLQIVQLIVTYCSEILIIYSDNKR